MLIRLQKALSQAGISSRRQGEQLILAGKVKVNGVIVTALGTKIDPNCDRITVDNCDIKMPTGTAQVILLNKPIGYLCSKHDPQGRPTIYRLLPPQYQHFYYVGRLDFYSSGALLLTNSGDLTQHLTHPRYHLPKTYLVWVAGQPYPSTLDRWRQGVILEGKMTLPTHIKVVRSQTDKTLLAITLYEGRNRQIRKTAELLGHPVLSLHRTRIYNLELGNLPSGKYRPLNPKEIEGLWHKR